MSWQRPGRTAAPGDVLPPCPGEHVPPLALGFSLGLIRQASCPSNGGGPLVLGPCSDSCSPTAFLLVQGGRRRTTSRSAGRMSRPSPRPAARPRGPGRGGVPRPGSGSQPKAFQLDPGSYEREARGFRASLVLCPGPRTCVAGPPTDPPAPGLPLRGHLPRALPHTSRPACLASCVSAAWVAVDVPSRRRSCPPEAEPPPRTRRSGASRGSPPPAQSGPDPRTLSVAPEPRLTAERPRRTSRPTPSSWPARRSHGCPPGTGFAVQRSVCEKKPQ